MKAYRFTLALFVPTLLIAFASLSAVAADSSLAANPVFQKNCAKCHGKTGEGRHFAGPSLISDKIRGASENDLGQAISNGKGRMPKFGDKLTPEEITTLVEQIKAANNKK